MKPLYLTLIGLLVGSPPVALAQADPNDVIELELEEIDTPAWVLEKIKTAKFEHINPALISGSDSLAISFPQDDIKPLPLPGKSKTQARNKKNNSETEKQKKDNSNDDVDPLPINKPDKPQDDKPTEDDPFPDDPFDPIDPDDPFDPIDPIDPDDPFDPDNPFPDNPWDPIGGGDNPIVIIDQIVNLGMKVWKIVKDNQPVIDLKYQYANAIPKGIDATELEYFSPIQARSFGLSGKNGFGKRVFTVKYTVVHRFGGKYNDRGAFLERVSVVPQEVEALWGYKINFNVLNVSVANVGSKENPIASLGLDAQLDIGTVIKKSNRRLLFEFRGDSSSVRRIAAAASR